MNKTVPLVQSPFFETSILNFGTTIVKNYAGLDSFVILFCVGGKCSVQHPQGTESLKAGEVMLIPASMEEDIALVPLTETKILEIFIP